MEPIRNNSTSQGTLNEPQIDNFTNSSGFNCPSFSLWSENCPTFCQGQSAVPGTQYSATSCLGWDSSHILLQPPSWDDSGRQEQWRVGDESDIPQERALPDTSWSHNTFWTSASEAGYESLTPMLPDSAWNMGLAASSEWKLAQVLTQTAEMTPGNPTGMDQDPWSGIHQSLSMPSKDTLLTEVARFFSESYERYPVIHPPTVLRKLDEGVHLKDVEFRTLVLSMAMMNYARQFRAEGWSSSCAKERLRTLASVIEALRMKNEAVCHFSVKPSLDTVVVSTFLFMAYIALRQHNRAFTYLTEAIGLLDMVTDLPDAVEVARMLRLEHLLFVTESATVLVFGWRRRRLARIPSVSDFQSCLAMRWACITAPSISQTLPWEDWCDMDFPDLDRRALKLLLSMSRLFTSLEWCEASNNGVGKSDRGVMRKMAADTEVGVDVDDTCVELGSTSTQLADLRLTQYWRRAVHWRQSAHCGQPPAYFARMDEDIQRLSSATVRLGRRLGCEQLRVIGLGKILALTDEIVSSSTVAGRPSATLIRVIGNLMYLVAEADYERNYAAQLGSIDVAARNIPRPVQSMRS